MTQRNRRGPIAATYDELQSLSVLRAARDAQALPRASAEAAVRAGLQAAEIALLNVVDLLTRATGDVDAKNWGGAAVKLSWAAGFHRVLLLLGTTVQRFARRSPHRTTLHVDDSPAFRRFFDALQAFDRSVLTSGLPMEHTIAEESLDSIACRVLHIARMTAHEATIWEASLTSVRAPTHVSYEQYIATEELRTAVETPQLTGDTFFMQFRGLHQIPEILAAEANDRIESAIRFVRVGDAERAVEQLEGASALMQVVVFCVPAMADNLATSDYHRIRENLGVTSGAHSAALHYHLFHDLYTQLASAIMEGGVADTSPLVEQAIGLRALIDCWRTLHMHLPRNNVGGVATKSLAGSPDAVDAVRSMRRTAASTDPLRDVAIADAEPLRQSLLQRYLRSEESLDAHLLAVTGDITKHRFSDVQQRAGIYADPPPFVAPPERIVE